MKKRSVRGLLISAVLGVALCVGMTSEMTVSAQEQGQTKTSISINCGNYDEVRPIYGSSSYYCSYVGGQVDLTVKNIKCRELVPALVLIHIFCSVHSIREG